MTPLFPFGYGLSYSNFAYSDLKVRKASDGGIDVTFNMKNTGKYPGDEVAQVYVGPPSNPPSDAQFAVKSLVGFDRVNFPAGVRKEVTIHIPLRQFQYWSTIDNGWKLPGGTRTIFVAASSRDIRAQENVEMNSLQ